MTDVGVSCIICHVNNKERNIKMANCCEFEMLVVGNSKESLERIQNVMEQLDKEWFLYGVREAAVAEPIRQRKSGLWTLRLNGYVAWNAAKWVEAEPEDEPVKGCAAQTNLLKISHELGLSVEIWTSEPGRGFQEHYVVKKGYLETSDTADWTLDYDENDEPIEDGGFSDYGMFMRPEALAEIPIPEDTTESRLPDELTDAEMERIDFLHDEAEEFLRKIAPDGRSINPTPDMRERLLEAVWDIIKDEGICTEMEFYPYREHGGEEEQA